MSVWNKIVNANNSLSVPQLELFAFDIYNIIIYISKINQWTLKFICNKLLQASFNFQIMFSTIIFRILRKLSIFLVKYSEIDENRLFQSLGYATFYRLIFT